MCQCQSYRFVYKEIAVSEDIRGDPLTRCALTSLSNVLISEMVVSIGNKCYVGFKNQYNGSVSQIGSGPWNIYIKTCKSYTYCIFSVFTMYFQLLLQLNLGSLLK
jgi:hypothetical protein